MATTSRKTAMVIGLWFRSGHAPQWVVTRERMNAHGEVETSITIEAFSEDDYETAKAAALNFAKRKGLCVIESDAEGQPRCIYTPIRIVVMEGKEQQLTTYRLYGDTVEVISGRNNMLESVALDDDMTADEIADAVFKAYDSDSIRVNVEPEPSILD